MTKQKRASELLRDVKHAGGCLQPVRLRGEFVNTVTGEVIERPLLVACKDRRAVLCASCADLYKADAWIVVSTGLIGGKGVPDSVATHPRLFLTLTAPSFGLVHVRREDGSCRTGPRRRCRHQRETTCGRRHDDTDPLLGSPLCEDCFNYRGAVLWNAESSRLWNRTFEQVRRRLAIALGVPFEEFSRYARLSYLKVAEFQKRGLVHFHVVLRLDGSEPFGSPPESLSSELLTQVISTVVPRFAVTTPHGTITWGSQFQVSDASALERDDLRIAGYIAKYATKTTDGSLAFARRFRSRQEISELDTTPHLRRLALTTWDLALEPSLRELNLRHHAHAFGVRSQLITKSRHYGTRFQDLREARAAFMTTPQSEDPISGTFIYDGRGYDDPRAAAVAQLLHQMTVEARRATRQKRPQDLSAP
ncbi:MAG: replication initiator [Acidimicrobiales bacterium]